MKAALVAMTRAATRLSCFVSDQRSSGRLPKQELFVTLQRQMIKIEV